MVKIEEFPLISCRNLGWVAWACAVSSSHYVGHEPEINSVVWRHRRASFFSEPAPKCLHSNGCAEVSVSPLILSLPRVAIIAGLSNSHVLRPGLSKFSPSEDHNNSECTCLTYQFVSVFHKKPFKLSFKAGLASITSGLAHWTSPGTNSIPKY